MQKENSEKTVFAYIVSQSSVGHKHLSTESNIFVLITFGIMFNKFQTEVF